MEARQVGREQACFRWAEIEGPSELASLATESRRLLLRFIAEWEKASGLAIDYQECGALDLAYSEAEWETLQARVARQSATGIGSKQVPLRDLSVYWPKVRTDGLVGASSILMTPSLTHAR